MLLLEKTSLLLIEEDQADITALQNLTHTLRLPYEYRIIASMDSAVNVLNTNTFDAIIAECRFEGGTVLDLIKITEIPIIAVANKRDDTIGLQAIKAGAYDYIIRDENRSHMTSLIRVIERAAHHGRLKVVEHQQRIMAEALRDTALALNESLQLNEVLEQILNNVHRVVSHDRACVLLVDDNTATIVHCRGWHPLDSQLLKTLEINITDVDHLNLMMYTQTPCIATDASEIGYWGRPESIQPPQSFLAAPICRRDEVIGFIQLESMAKEYFNAVHAESLRAFTAQAGTAIHNARLYAQAQTLAAMEERQRIARDLHDSVTQTLFSATIIGDTLLKLWRRNPHQIEEQLLELRDLNKGALAEMRTLLLELRPDSLLEIRLTDLISQLVETLRGRSRLQAHVSLTDTSEEIELPSSVRVIFFRIAQEALNNIIKHARAKNIWVELEVTPASAYLLIRDDGRGFDPDTPHPGHMGLEIMRERARSINANLTLHSEQDNGCEVILMWNKATRTQSND